MPVQQVIEGDVQITGALEVLEGINDVDIASIAGSASMSEGTAVLLDATHPTYLEILNGFDEEDGTTTAEVPLGLAIRADGADLVSSWLPQFTANGYTGTLTNLAYWQVQVSDDNSTWYSLEFDGSDWKDTLNAKTNIYVPWIFHTDIPVGGSAPDYTARTLYYRVRTVPLDTTTGLADEANASAWCSGVAGTQNPILSWNETIPPENGAISNLAGNTYAQVTVTFSWGDDTHSGTYSAGQYSGLAGARVWRRLNADGSKIQKVGDVEYDSGSPQLTHLDETSEDGVAYDYGLSMYDVNGNECTVTWYGTPVTPTYTAKPPTIENIEAIAYPDRIEVKWSSVSGPAGPYEYRLMRSTDGGSTYPDELVYIVPGVLHYDDPLSEVEYSAISGVNGYWYRVLAYDKYGNWSNSWTSTGADPTRDASYGTWTPATVAAGEIRASGSGRSLGVVIDRQGADTPSDTTDDLIQEDGIGIQISINDSNWYKPAFEATGATGVNRWYTGVENEYAEISELAFMLRNLPLTNESSGGPVSSETYYLRFKRRRHGTGGATLSGSWSSSVSIVCTATGATDVVENAFKQSQMDMTDWFLMDGVGLEAEWSLNDVEQSDAETLEFKDNSGNGHHLISQNQMSVANGPLGPCPHFNGTSDGMYSSHAGSIDFATDGTFVAWVYQDDAQAAWEEVFTNAVGFTSTRQITFAIYNEYLFLYTYNGSAFASRMNAALSAGAWHLVAFVVNDDGGGNCDLEMYIDGVLVGSASTTSCGLSPTVASLGYRLDGAEYFDGKLTGSRYYTRALSQAEIRWLYMNPAGNVPAMLMAERVAAGSILAESLTVLSKDLINNPTKTGQLGGIGHHDEYGKNTDTTKLELTDITYGGATVKAIELDNDAVSYGVRFKSFKVDQSKMYKVQWTVKSTIGTGIHYMGVVSSASEMEGDEAASQTYAGGSFLRWAKTDRSSAGTSTSNCYLDSTAAGSLSDFVTYTSYVLGYDREITDTPEVTSDNYCKIANPAHTNLSLRWLVWSADGTHELINISVQEVGSGTIVAENIAVANLAAINANIGTISDGGVIQDVPDSANNYWDLTNGIFRIGDAVNYVDWDGASLTIVAEVLQVSSDQVIISSATDEHLRLDHASATGQPYISWYQSGTKRGYIQYVDASDSMRIASEYGPVMIFGGSGGAAACVLYGTINAVAVGDRADLGPVSVSGATYALQVVSASSVGSLALVNMGASPNAVTINYASGPTYDLAAQIYFYEGSGDSYIELRTCTVLGTVNTAVKVDHLLQTRFYGDVGINVAADSSYALKVVGDAYFHVANDGFTIIDESAACYAVIDSVAGSDTGIIFREGGASKFLIGHDESLTAYRIYSYASTANIVRIDEAAGANSLYIDASGNVNMANDLAVTGSADLGAGTRKGANAEYSMYSTTVNWTCELLNSTDTYPVMAFWIGNHDSAAIYFDMYIDTTVRSADAGSNYSITKNSDQLAISMASGVAQGSVVAPAIIAYWDTSGDLHLDNDLYVDTIEEEHAASGVTIDGALLKDGDVALTSGDLKTTSGVVSASPNADSTHFLGRTRIDSTVFSDYAHVSHYDRSDTGNYALIQSAAGVTFINCEASQDIYFRRHNATFAYIDSNGFHTEGSGISIKSDDSGIYCSSGDGFGSNGVAYLYYSGTAATAVSGALAIKSTGSAHQQLHWAISTTWYSAQRDGTSGW